MVILRERPVGREPVSSDFAIEERALPALGDGELLVHNIVMSVDPSMRGRLEPTEKQYTTNFEIGGPLDGSAIGVVTQASAAGAAAGLTEGVLVRHRSGWREDAIVAADSVSVVDVALAPVGAWLGIMGQTGFTAYVGVRRIAPVAAGETVFVSAAAGAVGSVAGPFARLMGATTVIGSAGGAAKVGLLVDELGFDGAFDHRVDSPFDALARLAPDGVDVYFDNAGGRQLVAALNAMRINGRIALCGMMSQFDRDAKREDINQLIQAVLRRVTLRGFIVRDHEDLRPEFEREVAGWLRSGALVPRQTVFDGLDRSVDAFLGMLTGANIGKMLVHLDSTWAI